MTRELSKSIISECDISRGFIYVARPHRPMPEVDVSHTARLFALLLLRHEPRHGYELIKEIGRITGKEPSTSHVYPFLSTLEEEGLVEPAETGDRGKTTYRLTEAGRDVVDEQVDSIGKVLDAAIEGRLDECSHCGALIYEGGFERDGEIYCCEHCAAHAGDQK